MSDPLRILVASGWHDVNIGDIAHTPSLLGLLRKHCPRARVTLWPNPTPKGPCRRELAAETAVWLRHRFPEVAMLASGGALVPLPANRPDLAAAFAETDLLIVNSGGFHRAPAAAFHAAAGKPFMAFGCSFSEPAPALRGLFAKAAFVGCRDSVSLERMRAAVPASVPVEFCPDAVFAFALRNEAEARTLRGRLGLAEDGYLCVVPRLRHTPYHRLYGYAPSAEEAERDRINAAHRCADHAVLRTLIQRWVRATGRRVLACPEMTYGVELARDELVAPLPPDVRRLAAACDCFWMPDVAASVFARAAAVVSLDCHAPILALAAGTPAIHIRLPSDHPSKWKMFGDLGLSDWAWQQEEIDADTLFRLVMDCVNKPEKTRRRLDDAMSLANRRHAEILTGDLCSNPCAS